ncbi:hypothetical protein ASG61_21020 [Bacillus sp. Leaf75]|nr:hypothetical protein ASG61_21020 [Bacillus sp. Leaf75]
MLFIFGFNLLFIIVLLVTQPKDNKSNWWMITFSAAAAIGALQRALVSDIIPTLDKIELTILSSILFELHIYFHFLGQVVAPYAILMYAIVYANDNKPIKNRFLPYLLAIPMFIMIFFTKFHPDVVMNFKVLLIWVTPYYIIASYLMLNTWYREISIPKRKQKFRVCITLIPVWLGVYFLNNVLGAIDQNQQFFRLIPILFLTAYMLFVFYIFLHGAFGIKLKVEQQQVLDKSMKIMQDGTSVLNHTIKNEMSKIKFFFNIIHKSIKNRNLEDAEKSIDSVFSAIEGVDNMVDRIRSITQEIVPKETNVDMKEAIQECVDGLRDLFYSEGVKITTDLKIDTIVYGDKTLLKEIITNTLNNAKEAINTNNGIIHIQMLKMKNGGISIEITDNGVGISPEELQRIMYPYFSTKKSAKNHGLGLSLSYNIARAHDGDLTVYSELGKGTSIVVKLPKSRVVSVIPKIEEVSM